MKKVFRQTQRLRTDCSKS